MAGLLSEAPVWLADDSEGPGPTERWRRYVEASEMGGLLQHPAIVLDRSVFKDELSLVYEDRGTDEDEGSVGLFVRKSHRPRVVVRWPESVSLKTHVMVGRGLVGQPSPNAGVDLVAQATKLLRTNKSDLILFEDIDMESDLWSALTNPPKPAQTVVVAQDEPLWLLRFPSDPTDYLAQRFSSKTRWRFRRQAKRLEDMLDNELHLRCIRDASEVPGFVQAAAEVTKVSWQGRRLGRGIHDSERDRALLTRAAELGALRSYLLGSATRPVAFAVCYQWRGHFSYHIPAYDPEFTGASPGTLLLYRIVEHLVAEDTPRLVDFEAGKHEYKARFGTDARATGSAYLATRKAVASLLRAEELQERWRVRLLSSVRDLLTRAGVWARLRKLYRGGTSNG